MILASEPASWSFLDELRAFESGIQTDRHQWYVAHLEEPVVHYPKVLRPGRVVRDRETGRHELVWLSVSQYFDALGVRHLFDAADPSCLRTMQYQAINAWGYVGYQFGEECLRDLGYYEYEMRSVDRPSGVLRVNRFHRGGQDQSLWAGGRTEVLVEDEAVMLTDVNEWNGRFTGKSGVRCFEDLRSSGAQERIIREAALSNLRQLQGHLRSAGLAPRECLAREWILNGSPVRCSTSGLLACCHLLGPETTARFLSSLEMGRDELGTSLLDYMQRFEGRPLEGLIDLPESLREFR